MKHLVKLIYDVANNRKTTVKVQPNTSIDSDQLTKKFFPSERSEVYFFETEKITEEPDSQEDTEQNYQQDGQHPSSDIYSLLRQEVKIGVNPLDDIDDTDIISGRKPALTSIYYSSSDLRNFGYRFGLVYKNAIYEETIETVRDDMFNHIAQTGYQLLSINKERSLENYIFVVRGKILQQKTEVNMSDNGIEIQGIKYHSPDVYNIDDYNDIIIPTYTKSTSDIDTGRLSTEHALEQNKQVPEYIITPSIEKYIHKVVNEERSGFVYAGLDPLISHSSNTAYTTLPNGIDINNYRVIAIFSKTKGLSWVGFMNYLTPDNNALQAKGTYKSIDQTEYGYSKKTYSGEGSNVVDFYRLRTTHKYRTEDTVVAKIGGIQVVYQCSKGLGSFDILHKMLSMYTPQSKIENWILDANAAIPVGQFNKYNIQFGSKLYRFDDLQQNYGGIPGAEMLKDGAIFDITNLVDAHIEHFQVSTSYTSHVPYGKNKSLNTQTNSKISDVSQTVDSNTFPGNGLDYKTEVYPDSLAKIVLGESGLIKNINAEGTVSSKSILKIIAENFYNNNKDLSNITVTTKGYIDPKEDIRNILNVEEYIVDKVTYDFESNGTVVVIKTAEIN